MINTTEELEGELKFSFEKADMIHNGKGGFAILGETVFDKLEFVKTFLLNKINIKELSTENKKKKSFVVRDCPDTYDELVRIVYKFRELSCVILNNCEKALSDTASQQIFNHLLDTPGWAEEYVDAGFWSFYTEKDDELDEHRFSIQTFYIFLGSNMPESIKNEETMFSRFVKVIEL
jgi:hypothetical protein